MADIRNLLIIRRDNIGDLVCTTPLLSGLRREFTKAWIGVYANSYNAPVLYGNPDVDDVFEYSKLKHLQPGEGALSSLASRAKVLLSLRKKGLDLVVLAGGAADTRGARVARLLAPGRILCSPPATPGQHEVERVFEAARLLGVAGPIPPLRVVPDEGAVASIRRLMGSADPGKPTIGMHISARRPAQRWPVERFGDLIEFMAAKLDKPNILLMWSPGDGGDSRHPGDQAKAEAITARSRANPHLIPCRTSSLPELIGALSLCDVVLCSDGGAMHLAAGVGKPIACFFGDSPVDRWRPWGVTHRVLQARTGEVKDITVEEAAAAIAALK